MYEFVCVLPIVAVGAHMVHMKLIRVDYKRERKKKNQNVLKENLGVDFINFILLFLNEM